MFFLFIYLSLFFFVYKHIFTKKKVHHLYSSTVQYIVKSLILTLVRDFSANRSPLIVQVSSSTIAHYLGVHSSARRFQPS